jgi:hypothetical protein
MTSDTHQYHEAIQLTALSLQKFMDTTDQLTHLSIPERTALVEEIARVIPAGNVPSLISAGLAKLPGHAVSANDNRRNIALLMQGMQTFLDRAAYRAFFVGPAAVLSAYQLLLKLSGKDLEQSFPEGTWQFYVEFGLREDSSRHTCETVGFQNALKTQGLKLDSADILAAWVTASAWLLNHYDELLDCEWTERVRLRHIGSLMKDERLTERWLKSRPYAAPIDNLTTDFVTYRREMFENFCEETLLKADSRLRKQIEQNWNHKYAREQRAQDLAAYQHQMTICAALEPGEYSDMRGPLPRETLHIAIIVDKRYYLLTLDTAASLDRTRATCATILRHKPDMRPATLDGALCTVRRHDQLTLRRLLPQETQAELELLRTAPIILNWDAAESELLADIRGGQRGIGDHALTVFRTSQSTVFDLSHIFFDGPWGMAIAEIFTAQAVQTAWRIAQHPAINLKADTLPSVRHLALQAPPAVTARARKVQLPPEVSAESTEAHLNLIQDVRRNLQKRNAKLRLTVNDLLVLYRTIFGPLYLPSSDLTQALARLAGSEDNHTRQAAQLALLALDTARQPSPVLLIPMDATSISPRERIYATTFRNPFPDLLKQHKRALDAIQNLEHGRPFGSPAQMLDEARNARRDYLGTLQAFGEVMRRNKDVSLQGGSVSTATIKLLAGLPPALQRMLDSLPAKIDVVNDIVKGQEVFSNVGQVAALSSLKRFNTAKDDNEKKTLAWGILTDTEGTMCISLRDFRPHVAALVEIHQRELAERMTQDYLNAFASGLNKYTEALLYILRARSQVD